MQFDRMQRRFGIITIALSICGLILAVGCNKGPEPNPDIETHVGNLDEAPGCGYTDATSVSVTCNGPADELAELGDLCGFQSEPIVFKNKPTDGVVLMGPPNGPMLMVYGIVPDTDHDRTEEIRYAVYLNLDPGSEPEMEWEDGDALDGSMTTYRALLHACTVCNYRASGTLRWRNTTLTFHFGASGPPC